MRLMTVILCSVLAAGCGGGRSVMMPSPGLEQAGAGANVPAAMARVPESTSSCGTLYVAGLDEVDAYSLAAKGANVPHTTVLGGLYYRRTGPAPYFEVVWGEVAGISVGGNGTFDLLMNHDAGGAPGCTLGTYRDFSLVSNLRCPASAGLGVSGRPSGAVDVATESGGVPGSGIERDRTDGTFLVRLPLAARSDFFFAEDAAANVYVTATNPSRVEVYATDGAAVTASPVRTVPIPGTPGPIAVAPDGTIYVVSNVTGTGLHEVLAIPPGASAPSRTIGHSSATVSALAVDSSGLLYAAITLADGHSNKIKVFAADANGLAQPLRVLLNPLPYSSKAQNATIVSLAIAES
jgi:hypothetical protein